MKQKLILLCVVIALSISGFSKTNKPNVVIMLIDNHSYYELSRNGHPVVQTPRIDKLAETGVNFTDFNAPPFCSPSRAELLTGRYALRAGIYTTTGGVSILHKNEKTLADLLKEAGYKTGIFGKWHLGSSYPYQPKFRGFDEVFVHGGGGVSQLGDYYGNSHIDATYEHNGQYVKSRGFSTDVLFDQGMDFMARNSEEPFFCFISTPAVHFPTNLHPETGKRLMDRGVTDKKYLPIWSMIENVDDNVGRMLDFLKESGMDKNTLVILASDQGVNDRGVTHRAGEGTKRGVQYDEKHQVYCMIQYPELTNKRPGDRAELTGIVDLSPTVLDICGIERPANLDGKSLKPLLSGSKGWDSERKLIIQCPRKRECIKWDNVSVKYKKWRLVDGKELYDIAKDYGETVNVIEKHPALVKELKAKYNEFWNSLPPSTELLSTHILGAPECSSLRLVGMDWYIGDHPWTQQGLKNKTPQGKWRVEIARDGIYRMELRRYPREAPHAIEAVKAAVEVGEKKVEMSMGLDATNAVLEIELKKGEYDMQTIFSHPKDSVGLKDWGANYVYVDYLGK
jgi:arylsulfatase A-like enzyme